MSIENRDIKKLAGFLKSSKNITKLTLPGNIEYSDAKRVLVEVLCSKKNLLEVKNLESNKLTKALENNKQIATNLIIQLSSSNTIISDKDKLEIIQRSPAIHYLLKKDNQIRQLFNFGIIKKIDDIYQEVYSKNFMRIKGICASGQTTKNIFSKKNAKPLEQSNFNKLPSDIMENELASLLYDEQEKPKVKSFVEHEDYRRNKTLGSRIANRFSQYDPVNISFAVEIPLTIAAVITLSLLSMPSFVTLIFITLCVISSLLTVSCALYNTLKSHDTPILDYEMVRG